MLKFTAIATAAAALMFGAAVAADSPAHGSMADRFKAMDTDHDGKISKAEWIAAAKTRFAQLDTNHDGKLSKDEAKGGGMRGWEERFKAADKNNDGSLSEQEYIDASTARFDAADTNHDGYLDASEQQAEMDRMRGPGPSGH